LENEFGGYWRTRFYNQSNFSGSDLIKDATDVAKVDTRTRLYYTAKINENLKFVNKFEYNADWGRQGGDSYGDISTDGLSVKVKHSYADFNWKAFNVKVGAQGATIGRGLIFDDDFAGLTLKLNGDSFKLPLVDSYEIPIYWIKEKDDGIRNEDSDIYAIVPSLNIKLPISSIEKLSLTPFLIYQTSDTKYGIGLNDYLGNITYDNFDMYYVGFDFDADLKFDPMSINLWATGIYQYGTADNDHNTTIGDDDETIYTSAGVFAAGLGATYQKINLHGQAFYSTGADRDNYYDVNPATGKRTIRNTYTNNKAYTPPPGSSFYWAEIMGYGVFDNQVVNGSPADQISNLMAVNGGFTLASMNILPMNLPFGLNEELEKMSFDGDLWYASHVQKTLANRPFGTAPADDDDMETDLGLEIDAKITYKIIEGLKMEIVGAYLIAGDAVYKGEDDSDPFEIGTQLSLRF
jgi:hypothetical protein